VYGSPGVRSWPGSSRSCRSSPRFLALAPVPVVVEVVVVPVGPPVPPAPVELVVDPVVVPAPVVPAVLPVPVVAVVPALGGVTVIVAVAAGETPLTLVVSQVKVSGPLMYRSWPSSPPASTRCTPGRRCAAAP
jgi:hypothetical protein